MPFEVPIQVLAGPAIGDWAETAVITRVEFTPTDFFVRHSKEGTTPRAWPAVHIPGWGNGRDDPGTIQWTLWVVLWQGDHGVTCGCIEFYPQEQPSLGVHRGDAPAPFSSGAQNWWYQQAGMAGHQPRAGERIGLIAVAGDQRMKDVRSVLERSAVVWVVVPPNDTGLFEFPAPKQPPVILIDDGGAVQPDDVTPHEPPIDWAADLLGRLASLERKMAEIGDPTTVAHVGAKVTVSGTVRFLGPVSGTGTVVTTGD